MMELKKEWTNQEIVDINNGLWEVARLQISDKQVRWDISNNLRKAVDIARQIEEMKAGFKPETRDKETRELLKVMNSVEFRFLKRFDLEKIPGYLASMEVQIFNIITE